MFKSKFLICFSVLSVLFAQEILAVDIIITSASDSGPGTLREAIETISQEANFNTEYAIYFNVATMGTSTITLSDDLPLIPKNLRYITPPYNSLFQDQITIDGNNHRIFVLAPKFATSSELFDGNVHFFYNLNLINGLAKGGTGGNPGGGGGVGGGGALFIPKYSSVYLTNVNFINNKAVGGMGGDGTLVNNSGGGGGGGLFGKGGNGGSGANAGGGGGGGLLGNGGNATGNGGGAGGGGVLFNGGDASSLSTSGGGGGGGIYVLETYNSSTFSNDCTFIGGNGQDGQLGSGGYGSSNDAYFGSVGGISTASPIVSFALGFGGGGAGPNPFSNTIANGAVGRGFGGGGGGGATNNSTTFGNGGNAGLYAGGGGSSSNINNSSSLASNFGGNGGTCGGGGGGGVGSSFGAVKGGNGGLFFGGAGAPGTNITPNATQTFIGATAGFGGGSAGGGNGVNGPNIIPSEPLAGNKDLNGNQIVYGGKGGISSSGIGGGGGGAALGGAILSLGNCNLINCTFSNNKIIGGTCGSLNTDPNAHGWPLTEIENDLFIPYTEELNLDLIPNNLSLYNSSLKILGDGQLSSPKYTFQQFYDYFDSESINYVMLNPGSSLIVNDEFDYFNPTFLDNNSNMSIGPNGSLENSQVIICYGTLEIHGDKTIRGLIDTGTDQGTLKLNEHTLTLQSSKDFIDKCQFYGTIEQSSGSIIYKSDNEFILEGTWNYTGETVIQNGLFTVHNGSIENTAQVSVKNGAILSGWGPINNVFVESGAILIPGFSFENQLPFATMKLKGLNLDANSTVKFTLRGVDNSNPALNVQIQIPQTSNIGANLNGNLEIYEVEGYTYNIRDSWPILENLGNGQITGNFANITSSLGLGGYRTVLTDPNTLTLFLLIDENQLTGNAKKLATYLNENVTPSSEVTALLFLDGMELSKAMNAVSFAKNSSGTFITQNNLISMNEAINSRHADKRAMGCKLGTDCSDEQFNKSCRKKESKYDFWFSGIGQYGFFDPKHQNPSYQFINRAAQLGFDYYPEVIDFVGLGIGYNNTRFWQDHNLGNGWINQYYLNINGLYLKNDFYLDFAIWTEYHNNHNERKVRYSGLSGYPKAKATIYGFQIMPKLEMGYTLRDESYLFEPFLSLNWVNSWEDSYKEFGISTLDMNVGARYATMLQSELGCRFYQCFVSRLANSKFMFREKLSFVNKASFGADIISSQVTGSDVSLNLRFMDRYLNLMSFGFDLSIIPRNQNRFYLTLGYNGQFFDNYQSHEGICKLLWNF